MERENESRPNGLLTEEEAKKAGIEYPDPPETKCLHCGKILTPLGMVGFSGSFIWIGTQECGCEGATSEREEQAKKEAEKEAFRQKERFIRCGIKRRFLDAQITHAGISEYLNVFSDIPGVGLYIVGPSRAGKTYAASAIAKAFYLSGYHTLITTSLSMLDAVKASFDGDIKSGISRYASCDVLIVDDLGKENANSWVMTTLFQIFNERYEAVKPTIVTSQYLPDELKARMARSGEHESAEAIIERLKETCRLVRLPKRRNVNLMKDVLRDA